MTTPREREVETLLLTMFAAVPLYFTSVVGFVPLLIFHAVMAGITYRVWTGRTPELIPVRIMRMLAVAYVLFYIVDAAAISRSAISASTHLVLFIAAYQPIEAVKRDNHTQRLLTIALIFIASLATSVHITIILFVIAFGFLMLRQMIYVSHVETIRSVGRPYAFVPASRAAGFYLIGASLIATALFPLLPRLRNPVVRGFAGALNNATTGLSDTIDFNQSRTSTADPAVVARVWMGPEAIPFFTPLRLKAAVYDFFQDNRWLQTRDEFREIQPRAGVFRVARPLGLTRTATVQQRLIKSSRLFLPSGTYALAGLPQLYEGPTRDAYLTMRGRGETVDYQVSMARATEPLRARRVTVPPYPVSPGVAAMARQIVGNEQNGIKQAERVEAYLLNNFQYVQRPEDIGITTMNADDFLLKVRKGHCEYFAAGMVALMTALNVPSHIVGGFYGGRLNPLTGFLTIRREDAHAWVEVWDGKRWMTFDPTPPSQRPGNGQSGLLNAYATALSDSINYFWDRYILTYGLGDQIALAADMIVRLRDGLRGAQAAVVNARNAIFAPRGLAVVAVIGALIGALIALFRRRRPIYYLLEQRLRKLGIEVGPAMTMEEALQQLRIYHPDLAPQFEPVVRLYEEEQFSQRQDPMRRAIIRRELQKS